VMLANGEQIPEGRTPTAHEHYLTDERFCPEPRNDAANFAALRLRAHHDLVHIPRLHALTLTAEKVGSLANRTDNPTPVANETYECEVCQEPAASLFTIQPEYTRPDVSQTSGKLNTYFQIAAAKGMLRDQIAPLRCNSHPATRTPSALREQLIQHTCNKSSAHVCYTCARPVILSIRRTILGKLDQINKCSLQTYTASQPENPVRSHPQTLRKPQTNTHGNQRPGPGPWSAMPTAAQAASSTSPPPSRHRPASQYTSSCSRQKANDHNQSQQQPLPKTAKNGQLPKPSRRCKAPSSSTKRTNQH